MPQGTNRAGSSKQYGQVGTSYEKPSVDQASSTMYSKDMQCSNWIIYRLTEIVLFRAEAEIALAGTMTGSADNSPATVSTPLTGYHNGANLASSEELYSDAFNLIKAVYWRSNPSANSESNSLLPQIANFKTYSDYVNLLIQERRREFLFEAKRYYDLVRLARRNGNTNNFKAAIESKFEASNAISIKMKNMDFMYMPILKSQIKLNPNLKQNSQYLDEEESVKN